MTEIGVRENVRILVLIACFLVEVRARVQPNLSLEQGCPLFFYFCKGPQMLLSMVLGLHV